LDSAYSMKLLWHWCHASLLWCSHRLLGQPRRQNMLWQDQLQKVRPMYAAALYAAALCAAALCAASLHDATTKAAQPPLHSFVAVPSEMHPSGALPSEAVPLCVAAYLPEAASLMLNGSARAISNARGPENRALLVAGDSVRNAAGCEVALISNQQAVVEQPR